jgi:hypothetical protein
MDSCGPGYGLLAGACEYGSELEASIKGLRCVSGGTVDFSKRPALCGLSYRRL